MLLSQVQRQELLDQPGWSRPQIAGALRDLERLNRLFGGWRVILTHLHRMLSPQPERVPVRLLDLGTGGADIPRAIVRWAREKGWAVTILAVDWNPHAAALAHEWSAPYPEITVEQADALTLPLPDGAVDVCLSSLTLHHLAPSTAVHLLREMYRLARRGLIVNDLRRGLPGWALTWAVTRLLRTHPLVRHDGPLSIRRAYTVRELAHLAEEAGLPSPLIQRHAFFRMALTLRKDQGKYTERRPDA